jgi:ABC-type polysaccharide/polyol phosphate export permease
MTEMLKMLGLRDFREYFLNWWAPLTEILRFVLEYLIYFFTAKAFGKIFDNYFSYVVLGELMFFVPIFLFMNVHRLAFIYGNEGMLDYQMATSTNPAHILILGTLAGLPLQILRALLFVMIGYIFFNFRIQKEVLFSALILLTVSMPAFLGLSMMGAAVLIRFQKGSALMGSLAHFLSIFAGVYFPLSVLPSFLQNVSHWSSPFTILLEGTRNAEIAWPAVTLVCWGLISFSLGYFLLNQAFASIRKKGRPIFFSA